MRKALLYGVSVALLLTLVVLNSSFALDVKEMADSFRKKYEGTKNFSADFEQTHIVADRKRVARGKMKFQKPNLLRLEYFDPNNPEDMTSLTVIDGKVTWSYTPLINQVTKQVLVQDEGQMELLPGFGKSLENVEKNYSLSLVEDEPAKKQGVHVIELVPKNQGADPNTIFDALRVWIRDKDSVPVQFMYKDDKNKTTFVLSLRNVKLNQTFEESTFKFEVPKGAQVITAPSR
jgi:outer membrane lipoprotein carrier protein